VERKLATVMFVDLVGSTELVASVDPEVVRRRVTRFFDQVSGCIRAHGGTVEKYAGDSVMAAFGVPQAHEDDAERAARAALAIRDQVAELDVEVRIGVEGGEVVVEGADQTFATGGPVNLAARLQAEAAPGEILLGPTAHRLTLGRLVAEPLGPRELRGFAAPVDVWRLVGAADESGRKLSVAAPFVGRDAELELLENTWARAVRDRRAHLFTIYGEPGVGKSRLAREFIAAVEGATVLVGRCLPYGEGVTYWPLAEMVKAAAGISDDDPAEEAMEKLREACGEDAVADLLALASGVLEAVTGERSAQEIAWAAEQWATELADAQPLILGFEDIHWAEEPLLDLVEHLADRVRGVPVLVLCLARPELLDIRPGWGGGRVRATAIELERLASWESETLVDALLDDHEISAEARATLLEKTEGNPLFVEETIRMLSEDGTDGAERIPDTIQALIAARIDRLPGEAKELVQRGAVIGRVFWAGALQALSPDVDDLARSLDELVDREFVTIEPRSSIKGERAFRFKHVLIREVAYAGIAKADRAHLHRSFATWMKERGADELIEIRAYHLDHAAALYEELDGTVPAGLATEAAATLHRAGRRALAREANRPARKLLRRAVELEPTLERRYDAARAAWRLAELPTVSDEMAHVRRLAQDQGNARVEGQALTALAEMALLRDADLPRGRELVERALELLGAEDSEDRFDALTIRARIGWWLGDMDDYEHFVRLARDVARALGRTDLEATATEELGDAAVVRLDVERGEQLLARAIELADESGNTVVRARALHARSRIELLCGRLDDAEASAQEARELFLQAGVVWELGRTLNNLGCIAGRRGDHRAAERSFREAIKLLKGIEDRGTLCESQRGLALTLVRLGRLEEAEQYALEARTTVGPHDMTSRATTRMALGVVRAAQGRGEEAEELFREALEILEPTDLHVIRIELLQTIVDFLRSSARDGEVGAYEAELAELRPDSVAA
jgi:class 3 adenylate cyclase/tetratricopeptide (TPR) repeat protein